MNVTVGDLMPAPAYGPSRREHRTRLIAHRRVRTVALGPAMRVRIPPQTLAQLRRDLDTADPTSRGVDRAPLS